MQKHVVCHSPSQTFLQDVSIPLSEESRLVPEIPLQHLCLNFSVCVIQELFRKVRSILNKLTPQMFNQLMKQVTDLTVDTEERLKGVIDLVFEKAIDEPSFSVAYANMCRCLVTVRAARSSGTPLGRAQHGTPRADGQ